MSSTPPDFGHTGTETPQDRTTTFGAHSFLIRQLLSGIGTSMPVTVISCTNAGQLIPPGFVDVQPLVNQIDGAGNPIPHGIIHNLPYCRVQGGGNVIVNDPVAGDIGLVVFANRDISGVKSSKKRSNPGSRRQFDLADGIYVCSLLSPAAILQYIQFVTGVGINFSDCNGNLVQMESGRIAMTTDILAVSGQIQAGLEITAKYGTGDSVTVTQHTHDQAPDGHGDIEEPTNPPNAGT